MIRVIEKHIVFDKLIKRIDRFSRGMSYDDRLTSFGYNSLIKKADKLIQEIDILNNKNLKRSYV